MTWPSNIVSVEQAEDARAKAFEALLDAAKDYPERATSVQVMYAAEDYARAMACVEWARDVSQRLRHGLVCERPDEPEDPR